MWRRPSATTPGLASGTMWLGTSIPAFANEQPSRSGSPRSKTVTECPLRAQ
jgi:hypothetical protein